VATFGLASIFHGMAVVAIANRYSHTFPPDATSRAARARAFLPLVFPVLLLIPFFFFLLPILAGLVLYIAVSRSGPIVRFARSRGALLAGRVAVGLVVVALLPGAVTDVHDVIVRDDTAALTHLG
jgi:ABC-type tungstate transport system substrate-binding protein